MLTLERPQKQPSQHRVAWYAPLAFLPVVLAVSGMAAPFQNSNIDKAAAEIGIKAAYIYNFARFIEWPPRATPGPLRIAVLGSGELKSPLAEVVKGKSANGRPIEVRHIRLASEAECCEILLIERSESGHLKDIVQALSGKPVLTVCDSGNGLRDGVMIDFQMVDDSVRFQINRESAEHAGLKISSQLLKVAIPLKGKR